MHKLLFVLFTIFVLLPLQAYAIDVDELLSKTQIKSNNQVYDILNYEYSAPRESQFIRIIGETISGDVFRIVLKQWDSTWEKVWLYDGEFHDATLVEKIVQPSPFIGFGGILDESPDFKDIKVIASQPFQNFWRDQHVIETRVYYAEMNFMNDISYKEGYVEGVDVSIIIYDPRGEVFKEFSGTTDNKGFLTEKFLIVENLTIPGEYTTVITATDGPNTTTTIKNFFVIASTPPDSSPLDSDGDGIPDSSDSCPNSAEDFDGVDDTDGCPE